jgi:signal transduction histidine kinase/CheY-like chemotaxis protein
MTRLLRVLGGLRGRIGLIFLLTLLATGAGLHQLLVRVTREWLVVELGSRGRTISAQLAERSLTPLLVGDRARLKREFATTHDVDLVGVAAYDTAGRMLVSVTGDSPGAQHVPWGMLAHAGAETESWPAGDARHSQLIGYAAPVERHADDPAGLDPEAREVYGLEPAAKTPAAGERVGEVVVVMSTARLEGVLESTTRYGLVVLLTTVLIGVMGIVGLMRIMVRPLREASELAREIASGHLDRRLPVRSHDELGSLAHAMNTMAEALTEARAAARTEAEALQVATSEMLAIARAARTDQMKPGEMFALLSAALRHVTGCDRLALLSTAPEAGPPEFRLFDPPAPWGALQPATPLDAAACEWLPARGDRPFRVALAGATGAVAQALVANGGRAALMVPLGHEGTPRAALLVVSSRDDAFTASETDIVAGLASHLSSALQAAALRERLERAFDELQATRSRLVRAERLRAAGEMASGIAHDFNNVLGAILGRAQLLKLRSTRGTLTPEELLRSLEVIERAAADGGDTVARLRQFGKAGETPNTEIVNLEAAMREAAEFTRTRWENEANTFGQPIRVIIEAVPECWVNGRSSELREAFTNIILNAVDALPQGGDIRLRCDVEDERVVSWIEDNGHGMSEQVRRRVFDPFFTTKGERGTGLGLSVVYGIIQRHGGEIAIYSEEGVGTRVEISLPLASPLSPRATEGAPRHSAGATLQVLIVDDEEPVRELLVDVVRALGHVPTACNSGERALAVFHPAAFDLVLTDLGMPGLTGWQLAQQLREQDPDLTIAFITGWGQEITPEAVRDAGGDAVVAKPFGIEDVERLTILALERRGRREAA